MYSSSVTQWCLLLLTIFQNSIDAFTIQPIQQRRSTISDVSSIKGKGKHIISFLQLSSSKNDQDEEVTQQNEETTTPAGMSFEEATEELKKQEDEERAAARGAMFEEVSLLHTSYLVTDFKRSH